jgi:glycine oxidase
MPGLSSEIRLALGISEDHWLDNEKLMLAVIEAAKRLGVRFHAHSPVKGLSVRDNRVEGIQANLGQAGGEPTLFSAGCYVLAAGCWSGGLAAQIGLRLPLQPCRGQMVEFESPREIPYVVRAGIHYLVPRSARRIVVGTTAEYTGFEKAVTAEGLQSILYGAIRVVPFLKDWVFRRAWAGLRPDTADHLPVLGYGALLNLVLATGHFRHGILLAPVTAQQISELVLTGSTSLSLETYRPNRFV